MSDQNGTDTGPAGDWPEEVSESLIEELQTQAAQLEEQAAELEAFNDELSASEARLKGVIDSALDAIVTTDARSRVIDWNEHAEMMFGWSAREAVGRTITELIIPEQYREAHRRGVERYLSTGEKRILNRRIEISAVRRDGAQFPVELTVSATRWGSEVVFTSFIRDITERRQDERRRAARGAVTRILASSESREDAMPRILRAVCESLGWVTGCYWEVGHAGDEVMAVANGWADPAMEEVSVFSEQAEGMHMHRGVGLPGRVWETGAAAWIEDIARDENFPRRALAEAAGLRSAFAFPVTVGDRFLGVLEFFDDAPTSPDQRLLETMSAVGSDVGQFLSRRAAEEKLEERNARQRFLARSAAALAAAAPSYRDTLEELVELVVPALADWCSVYAVDRSGEIRRVVLIRDGSEEGDAAEGIGLEGDRPSPRHPIVRLIETGEPLLVTHATDEVLAPIAANDEELAHLRKLNIASGMIVPLTARGRVLGGIVLVSTDPGRLYGQEELDGAMEFASRAAMFIDNARLFRDAQVANQTKADFLATISHELRTPLNAVLGYTDLLLQGIPEPISDPVADYVRRIGLSARHLLQLIEEILTYSRLEAGREQVSPEPFDMATVADEVMAVIEPLASEKALELAVDVSEVDRKVSTDARKVRQILLNLLSNAVKFTDRGRIDATGRIDGSELVLTVRDTGIGVAADHLERIFEPFWQVEQSNTRTAHGTGLGLSVTRRFARLLGGDVTAASEPGVGSCFEVRIPADLPGQRDSERRVSERGA